jgi:hypothetical protein
MAACVHCGRAKGKRACPALHGAICSPCCGQHRLKTISCPSDCQWLGGLAVVRDDQPIGEFSRAGLTEAVAQIAAFSRTGDETASGWAARTAFFGSDARQVEIEEWAQQLFIGHLFYGHRDDRGRRLIDRFAERRARELGRDAAMAVRSLRASWASLFEIEKIHRGAGFELRDLASGDHPKVSEVSGTYQLRPKQLFYAWLMPVGDRIEMVGPSCLVPDHARTAVLRRIGEAPHERGTELAALVYQAVSRGVRELPLPKLNNTDGDELVFCKAHYAIDDAAAVRARLVHAPGLEVDEDGFRWTGATTVPGFGGSVALGRIIVDGRELVLETNSRQRLERGKRRLTDCCGPLIRHRADSVQSVESLMREPRSERSAQPELPPEVQAEVIGSSLRDAYASWVEHPLPALDGKTPREAARTKRGRARVRALVDDIEASTLAQPGGDTVDFGALRELLRLDDDVETSYDAAHTPPSADWLARDEAERIAAVAAFHRRRSRSPHPATPNPRLHAMLHVIVENQLALGQPAEVRGAMGRLRAGGLSRHEALHAIGELVAEGLWTVLREQRDVDRDGLAARLDRLGPGHHRGSAP